MIMRPGHQLLLPASKGFIWGSLMTSIFLTLLINMGVVGRAVWLPDLVSLLLLFWSIHQPRRIGIGIAFMLGLIIDVHQGAVLGQHALSYSVLSFLALIIHRRLLWFTVPSQAFQVLPLFVACHAIELLARMLTGGTFPGFWLLLAPLLESLLWPVVSILLLLPQKRTPNPDAHRPL
jgi:rod shape-determining protein MreD